MEQEIIDWTTEYPTKIWAGMTWQYDAEAQRKIHPEKPLEYFHPSAVEEDLRGLILTMKDAPRYIKHWDGEIYHSKYARGMLRSIETYSYGEYILKCILPKGKGLHTSFWLSGANTWPPEIDIFEAYSNGFGGYYTWPAKVWPNISRAGYKIESNVHYGSKLNHYQITPQGCFISDLKKPATEINTYRLVWSPEEITIYYNDILVRCTNNIIDPELFDQLNESPWMYIVMDIGYNTKKLSKDGTMKAFKDPDFKPEFILKEFKYNSLYND